MNSSRNNNKTKKIISTTYIIIIILITCQYFNLQIINYEKYHLKAGYNSLKKIILKAPRGIIYDRNKKPIVDRDDNRIITASKKALCEIYPTLKFMINQTISKNNLDEMDRFDLEKVCKHLEELNNICNTIYAKS